MKTSFTIILFLVLGVEFIYGQTNHKNEGSLLPFNQKVKQYFVPLSHGHATTGVKSIQNGTYPERNDNPVVTPQGIVIGSTTYDLQSNGSNCNRIYNYNDTVGAIWNNSLLYVPTYPDRGTGYGFYDGSAWNAVPR